MACRGRPSFGGGGWSTLTVGTPYPDRAIRATDGSPVVGGRAASEASDQSRPRSASRGAAETIAWSTGNGSPDQRSLACTMCVTDSADPAWRWSRLAAPFETLAALAPQDKRLWRSLLDHLCLDALSVAGHGRCGPSDQVALPVHQGRLHPGTSLGANTGIASWVPSFCPA